MSGSFEFAQDPVEWPRATVFACPGFLLLILVVFFYEGGYERHIVAFIIGIAYGQQAEVG